MEFVEIVISYPQFCVYEEYKEKPYFSIKYTENGQEFIGFGTYKLEVLSEYLRSYFMTPQIVPCEDCVSRKEVIKLLEMEDWADTVEGVLALPPVTPKARWISVYEGMPEDGQNVLFCDIDGDVMVGYHVRGRAETHFSQAGSYEHIKNVRAWMPLPTPYVPDTNVGKMGESEGEDDDE